MNHPDTTRRALLLAAVSLPAACANPPSSSAVQPPPIVFVHGNGDTAGLWLTTLWRFESNGWPRERLHAVDMPYPLARDLDAVAQPGRSSTDEQMRHLSAEVDAALQRTGAQQVVLVGNSRGGFAIRNYIANGGGAAKVSHVVLGGTPNHGVYADAALRPGNEFNGAGPFLTALNNQGAPGVEVTPGPRWMTIRSFDNDKFAQPEGTWLGRKGEATNVTHAGPELRGAQNVVLPKLDHRETSFSAAAFAETYTFITGRAPATTAITPQTQIVLDGKLSGQGLDNDPARGSAASNLPLVGATVEVYATDANTGARIGDARWRKTVSADGRWGPFTASADTSYEFVISAPGYAVTHIYRAPFPRSSDVVNLRADRLLEADKAAGAVVVLTRPRGYFQLGRDSIVLDGIDPAPGIPPGVAGLSVSRVRVAATPERAVAGRFNDERIVGRTWATAQNHLVLLELHH